MHDALSIELASLVLHRGGMMYFSFAFRTAPRTAMQPLLEPYNALAGTIRGSVVQMFGISGFTRLVSQPELP